MALTTPALARADLNTLLATLTGANTPLDYDPFVVTQQGATVSVFFTGYDAHFWNFAIRIYVQNDPGAREGQVLLDTLMPAIEALLDSQWGPVQWTVEFDRELQCLVAEWPVTAGRE